MYDLAAVDADDEVEPWLDGYLVVLVAQDLEAKCSVAVGVTGGRVGVQAGDEAVQGTEHGRSC